MRYPFNVVRVQEDVDIYWVARSACLDGCIGQGETAEEAISELRENEAAWLETAAEVGIKIPSVPVEDDASYSGKLSLRMSPAVHKKAAALAKREGISLNQYIGDAVVNYNAELSTSGYISKEVAAAAKDIGSKVKSGNPLYKRGVIAGTK